jgi:hypothetical protein
MQSGKPFTTTRNKLLFPCPFQGPNFVSLQSPLYFSICAFSWPDVEICKVLTHLLNVGILTRLCQHSVASVKGGLLFDVGVSDTIHPEAVKTIPDPNWFPLFWCHYVHQLHEAEYKLTSTYQRHKEKQRERYYESHVGKKGNSIQGAKSSLGQRRGRGSSRLRPELTSSQPFCPLDLHVLRLQQRPPPL